MRAAHARALTRRSETRGRAGQRGAALIYVLVMIGVLVAFMSLAIDVGRLYLIQSELQTAADAGALAAATRLIGTANSQTHAAADAPDASIT